MKPVDSRPHLQAEASGPVLAWCTGQRCTALHNFEGSDDRYERLRATVRTTPGAVLIASPCLGRCELSSLAGVGRRHGPTGQVGPMAWFAEVEDGSVFEILLAWIASGGPNQIHRPDYALPSALRMTLSGIGLPPKVFQR